MISRIDHVALAVKDYDKALRFFLTLFGAIPGAGAPDGGMKYFWQNLAMGDLSRFELLTPTGKGSFLDNFLHNKEGGIHHITFETPDIRKAKKILEENNIPYFGYNDLGSNWKELFIHPRDAFGVLIQIAQFTPGDWISPEIKMPEGVKWRVRKKESGPVLDCVHPGGGKVSLELSKEEARELIRELEKML